MGEHLWEIEHPYYATEGNFFKHGYHACYSRWADFLREEFGDMDLNLLYRFDWKIDDEDNIHAQGRGELYLYFVLQRKAIHRSVQVSVEAKDEDAVRAWLMPRFAKLVEMWAPISPTPASAKDGE